MNIEDFTTDRDLTKQPLRQDEQDFLNSNADDLPDDVAEHYGVEKSAPPFIPKAPESPPNKPSDDNTDDEEDDDLIDPEDEKRIGKILDKKVAPILQQTQEQANTMAVDNFIRSMTEQVPTASKYRDAMLQTLKVPGYSHLSPQEVFNIVAGAELMRLGAKKEREAATRARSTQNNVNLPGRPSGGSASKDWSQASAEEFAAKKAEVLGRPA